MRNPGYQSEVIDLAELKARREQIQGRRQVLVTQRDQEQRLQSERQAAKSLSHIDFELGQWRMTDGQ